MTPPKTACHKPYMQNFKRRQNEQIQFLHEATSFDLLNSTLSYGTKMNGYLISSNQTKISNIKSRKKKCHEVSVIYVTLQKFVQIFIVASLVAGQTVTIR